MNRETFSLKLQRGGEIRRVQVTFSEDQPFDYDALVRYARDLFFEGVRAEGRILCFRYKDEQNDTITVRSTRELEEALRVALNGTNRVLKLRVLVEGDNEPEESIGCSFGSVDDWEKTISEGWSRIKKWKNQCKRQRGESDGNSDAKKDRRCKKFKKAKKCFLALFLIAIFAGCVAKGCCLVLFLGIVALAVKCGFKFCKKVSKGGRGIFNCKVECRPTRPLQQPKKEQPSPPLFHSGSSTAEDAPFQSKMNQLEEMGFRDRSKNIEVLINNGGDLLQSVKDLLEKGNKKHE
eukprot:TRINITY_DN799_c0_g1_i1.p1 TRINITY_DN799_c0_g1~~TRINITY_DN799_c0_g1_i1.p1  ORF type:complete len:292 (+),score=93.14 TRINITY_DN799_c0_g1_i1:100-975(+)